MAAFRSTRCLLERLVKADGGGAVEDDVDAGGELLHVLWADGQTRLRHLAADGYDFLVEVRVVVPHAIEELQGTNRKETFDSSPQ